MANIEEILKKLNEEQIKPVLDTEGAVLVIAGAGSGKTRVLTSRIAYLILEKGINPSEIMAITFTNKAAGEMKERLVNFVSDIGDMWVSTIHSMCVKILRRDIDKIGYDKNFTIYDDTDKERVLKRIFEFLGYDKDKFLKPAKNIISSCKNDCLSPEEYREQNREYRFVEDYFKIYQEYENELNRSNSLDFDDLLYKTYQLFKTRPEVADYYSNRFKYIHIDEFQDTNKVQFLLAERLSLTHRNIFVVGDDDQSIYGWRGAKIENILSFDKIFNDAKIYKLERNYRSTKKILELANCIISNNTERREKTLWTDNQEGARIETFVGTHENSEASYTAIQIKNLIDRYNLCYKDFAVFMRVNALSRAFEQEFMKYGIPCRIFGGFRFFERKEIKDILSYLKIIVNHFDNESFVRAVSTPKRGIGDKTLNELKEYSSANGISMYDAIDMLNMTSIGESAKTKLFNFKTLLVSFESYAEKNSISELIEFIIDSTGFNEQFEEKSEENTSKLMNINELKNSAEQFEKDNVGSNLSDYLNSVTLSSDTDDINDGDAVTLATIHSAKGLEYTCVFVSGLDEGILPVSRSFDAEEDLEEERRLMYVAVTRAKERLYLTRAMSRYMYGKREYMSESRFLKESRSVLGYGSKIEKREKPKYNYGEDYSFEDSGNTFGGGYSSDYAKTFLKSNKPKENTNAEYGKYKTGVKVKHAKFGEGTVIMVKGEGDNIIVDVAFKGFGIKSLSAKYAPMEII